LVELLSGAGRVFTPLRGLCYAAQDAHKALKDAPTKTATARGPERLVAASQQAQRLKRAAEEIARLQSDLATRKARIQEVSWLASLLTCRINQPHCMMFWPKRRRQSGRTPGACRGCRFDLLVA
jgi:hypothetical protein